MLHGASVGGLVALGAASANELRRSRIVHVLGAVSHENIATREVSLKLRQGGRTGRQAKTAASRVLMMRYVVYAEPGRNACQWPVLTSPGLSLKYNHGSRCKEQSTARSAGQ